MGFRLPATIRQAAEWMRRFARTTPGVLSGLVVATVALCLLAGFVGANQLSDKQHRRDALLERTEPLADAAQSLYVALSAADASAATAFLSGGIETPQVRMRYQQALADAASALATATAGAGDEQTRKIVARIAADLPAYTGLVETARANNRQGFPVGSAYLREASTLMQQSLLVNAEALTKARFAAVREEQRAIGEPPRLTYLLLGLVLAACAVGSYQLRQRTNRRVNIGIAAAAGATGLALLWILTATLAANAAVPTGASGASTRFETMARSRILAQQARADETLALITRGDITNAENQFNDHTNELRVRLQAGFAANSTAVETYSAWVAGHKRQVELYQASKVPEAVAQATGTGQDGSAGRFAKLDEQLRAGITQTRGELRAGAETAGHALLLSPAGTLALLVFAAAAVVAGVWPRLKEFL
ncbi:hypothetical protein [Nocardia sp. NPDC052566]|uniref:hypothetical protein n=1 Tax=Nocardia sp. NPDC052566 TaxID=3364330 RepID=UPI0037CCA4DE